MKPSPDELTGLTDRHIITGVTDRFEARREVIEAFQRMHQAAKKENIDIGVVSGFRSFQKQLHIWNQKFSGRRPVLDHHNQDVDISKCTATQLVDLILIWSAIPGGSRHHWGTDLDVIDRTVIPKGYEVRLIDSEYTVSGLFHRLNQWLTAHASEYGFYAPYTGLNLNMYAEPWHISYFPLATGYLQDLTPSLLKNSLEQSDILGKEEVLEKIEEIFNTKIKNVAAPP